jgi:hypothetical protein
MIRMTPLLRYGTSITRTRALVKFRWFYNTYTHYIITLFNLVHLFPLEYQLLYIYIYLFIIYIYINIYIYIFPFFYENCIKRI